ncbi:hypothetical protein BO71DRAFT_437152 [Aspergillus ellipticus CBS 707.79]|uniref:Uncharacterized protein n=1 Tax=Aspergillus ellipticus CBS 707.79 TaxID=1448320 RepID=A0A319DU40_9EURO|nr:hypothetical protein BO71DRAFT_437152 [Aspergillus ellipticus CBS 707.79]
MGGLQQRSKRKRSITDEVSPIDSRPTSILKSMKIVEAAASAASAAMSALSAAVSATTQAISAESELMGSVREPFADEIDETYLCGNPQSPGMMVANFQIDEEPSAICQDLATTSQDMSVIRQGTWTTLQNMEYELDKFKRETLDGILQMGAIVRHQVIENYRKEVLYIMESVHSSLAAAEVSWTCQGALDADLKLYVSGERDDENIFRQIYGLSVQSAKYMATAQMNRARYPHIGPRIQAIFYELTSLLEANPPNNPIANSDERIVELHKRLWDAIKA